MPKRLPAYSSHFLPGLLLSVVVALLSLPATAGAADATFVGILALAAEDDAAKQLGLSSETREKLLDLINRREREALSLALNLRDLPPSEAAKRLEPFVMESERLGFQLLTVAQREKLQHIRLARAGMMSLLEDNVGQVLDLTADQRTQIEKLAEQRSMDLGRGNETQRRLTNAMYERRMVAVLTDNQRATWERMAGLSVGGDAVAQADSPLRPSELKEQPETETESTESPAEPARTKAPTAPAGEPPAADIPAADAPARTPTQPVPATTATPEPEATSHGLEPDKAEPDKPEPDMAAPRQPAPSDEPVTPDSEPMPVDLEAVEPKSQAAPAAEPALPAVRPASPVEEDATTVIPSSRTVGSNQLRFSFVHTPFADVIEWFADEAGLALQRDTMPTGTFNYTDPRYYTAAEALDLMNSILLTKGYTLLRRNNMLMVIDLEEVIPPELVELVPLEELDKRGNYELVKTLFQLARMTPEEAEADISRLLGPQGRVIVMPSARQVLVQETAGKLKTIRAMIERVEDPTLLRDSKILVVELEHVTGEELMMIARPLLGLPEEENVGQGISIAVDPLGSRVFATGTPDMLQRLEQIIPLVDKAGNAGFAAGPVEQPRLETYAIVKADPTTVLSVLQTLLAGIPDVRLAVEPVTNKLIAFARPSEHQTITDTLRRLEGQADQFDVIKLRRVDPQVVVLMANKFFGGGEGETGGPIIDGDPLSMQLWVRGTQDQLAQVRDLVEKLEGPADGDEGNGDTVRMLPFTGRAARTAIEQAEFFWPAMQRPNRIRVVTPSAVSPSMNQIRSVPRGSSDPAPPTAARERSGQPTDPPASATPPRSSAPPAFTPDRLPATILPGNETRRAVSLRDQMASQPGRVVTRFVQFRDDERVSEQPNASPAARPDTPSGEVRGTEPSSAEGRGADIIISITPSGIIIASEDTKALDEFERLLRSIMDQSAVNNQEPVIFWLKFAKATPTAELLREILGASGGASDGGGSILGDVASSMLGDLGGGLVGGLLGLGGGGTLTTTGDVSIVADSRLNALIVQANPADLDLIEQLLPVFDREASPEDIETYGKPRLIPVIYTSAEEIAAVVRSMYGTRILGAESATSRQPSPQDLIQALRGEGGGRGGRGGRGGERTGNEEPKFALGVDRRSNSLIVTAPEPLFLEVKELVEQIDQAGLNPDQTVQIRPLGGQLNAEVVQRTLMSILGPRATTNNNNATSPAQAPSQPSGAADGSQRSADDIRRSTEFLRNLQQIRESGGGGERGRPDFGGSRTGGSGRGTGGSPFGGRSTGGGGTSGGGPGGGGPGGGGSPFGGRGR